MCRGRWLRGFQEKEKSAPPAWRVVLVNPICGGELTQRCLNAEQEAGRLRGLLQRLNSAGAEEGLPAPRPFPAEGAEASVFALPRVGLSEGIPKVHWLWEKIYHFIPF